jgi:hypothetical protein
MTPMKLEKMYSTIFKYLSTMYGEYYFTTRYISDNASQSLIYSLNIIKGDKFDNSSVIPIINIFKLCDIKIFELRKHSTKSNFTFIITLMYDQEEQSITR